jgi:hypothetical protein
LSLVSARIFFTGSPQVGKIVHQAAARHLAGAVFLDDYKVPQYKFHDWQLLAGSLLACLRRSWSRCWPGS